MTAPTPTDAPRRSCGACKWIHRLQEDYEFGVCLCPLPTWVIEYLNQVSRDVQVTDGEHCGCFAEKTE